ncbi:peptide transporter permease SapC [Streptomyces sp. NBC_00304]|uniref:peptide transporter permease SapC n=1 Tax=Streptomyces sp. NBC_00304 TaxID=2975706 RepID=UPI002E2BBE95|nr:peptide transporter permease SapC [Streptomyces sp. NBC_00304]
MKLPTAVLAAGAAVALVAATVGAARLRQGARHQAERNEAILAGNQIDWLAQVPTTPDLAENWKPEGMETEEYMRLTSVTLLVDGARALTAEQLGRIRLDPAEHDLWAVHDLATWQELMAPRAFARLDAIERARRGEGPACLITHT